jgi:hypothetical protein
MLKTLKFGCFILGFSPNFSELSHWNGMIISTTLVSKKPQMTASGIFSSDVISNL